MASTMAAQLWRHLLQPTPVLACINPLLQPHLMLLMVSACSKYHLHVH